MTTLLRRLTTAGAAVLLVATLGAPAGAAPDPKKKTGTEGETPLIRDVLESASRGFIEARTAYRRSRDNQERLSRELVALERRRDAMSAEVSRVAAAGYRAGRLNMASALLRSDTPDAFLDRAAALETMTERENAKLRELNAARADVTRARAAIDAEIGQQQRQLALMTKKREAAQKLFSIAGGDSFGNLVSANIATAERAPGGDDGNWPGQGCSSDDPTTSGCITARTLHALKQSQKAGFKRFVSCFRPGGPFEHPKGRACDFSVQKGDGFGGDATGGDKVYGSNLAAFLVKNADRLGVMYVIWYRRVWLPSTGWTNYTEGGGDPSSDHTNHVHLSML
ncbi:coiled-coil domain-containing protein [Pilimelia anulata]|uniref:coiled-coil domain-containing protein n=1 Tax=Pilimelia anulata TaxID=53371 RepID=UPI0016686CD8